MKLEVLSINFLLYTIAGLWRPIHWSSKLSKSLYNVYTALIIYIMVYFFLTHLMYVIFVVKNLEDFVSCFFFSLSAFNALFKVTIIVTRRNRIINLIEILQEEPCKVRDKEEIDIEMKFDRLIRLYSMPYLILCASSAMGGVLGGILYMLEGQIPYGYVRVPWDCTSYFIFFLTCLQEIIADIYGILISVATETTVLGFCLQTCAQFEILKHRLQKTIKHGEKEGIRTSSAINVLGKTNRLSEHVSHHLCIIRLAQLINDIFNQMVFVQFSTTILVLCTLTYYMVSESVPLNDIVTLTAYLCATFVQIFYYCWGGNEVTLTSIGFSDEIYNMDWLLMTSSEQKDLLMIMKRSTRPIKFTSSFLVTLSLESFANIMKASFSVFNILQQM